uniref:CSRNP_N domain-containing protein n=1 Tax=Anisakis simplex TaxID=6269 RepID=A0A0M3J958_ANISI
LEIKVDRPSFPCPCSSASCSNPEGRVEFNAVRVRAHYLETMMRIQVLESNYNFDGVSQLICLFGLYWKFKDTFVDVVRYFYIVRAKTLICYR